MKKFLLSLAVIACAASMSAESYTLISSSSRGTWTQDGTSYVCNVTNNGKTFTITYDKGSYNNDIVDPSANASWRAYKGTKTTISCSDVTIKTIEVGFDSYTYNGNNYYSALEMPEGWTGILDETNLTYTASSETGANSVTFTAAEKQVRIVSLAVSDEAGEITPPEPDGVIFDCPFSASSDLDNWTQTYISGSMPDGLNAFYVNSSQKCLCASSYVSSEGTNQAVQATLSREFDLTDRENCKLTLSQAFGYYFPTSQAEADNYTLYVVDASGAKQTLDFANYGAKGSGNWTSFAENEFDLSEFDGQKITLGFEFNNTIARNCTWEIKNFLMKGDKTVGVAGISADENVAPIYYNLQGVRVENPENGLYIVVKGNKSTKVVF